MLINLGYVFEPHEPHDIFAEFDMDSLLLFPHTLVYSKVLLRRRMKV
jgi:hypothetical protein